MRPILLIALCLSAAACSKTDIAAEAPTSASPATPDAPDKAATSDNDEASFPMAPDFTLPALGGGDVSLAAHRGKVVVLEWFNPQCPFVVQSHTDGTLKGMRAKHADVVWLAINSGSPGKQGHGVEINTEAKARFGMDYPLLFDEDGKVGRAYGAERTPHMYVINPEGRIVYQGAIDNSGGGDIEDTPKLENHVADALADLGAKRAPRLMRSKSWGCTVKYPD